MKLDSSTVPALQEFSIAYWYTNLLSFRLGLLYLMNPINLACTLQKAALIYLTRSSDLPSLSRREELLTDLLHSTHLKHCLCHFFPAPNTCSAKYTVFPHLAHLLLVWPSLRDASLFLIFAILYAAEIKHRKNVSIALQKLQHSKSVFS